MTDSEVLPLDSFRGRVVLVAVVFLVLSVAGLVVVGALSEDEGFECLPPTTTTATTATTAGSDLEETTSVLTCSPASESGFKIHDPWTTAISTVLGTVLAVAVVSLLFEFRLRRSFGHDLLRFLDLKKSLVVSGLSDVDVSTRLDTRSALERIDDVVYVGRTPEAWLNENFPTLLRVAEKRQLHITVSLPDPDDDPVMGTVAASMGVAAADLSQSIRAFVASAQAQWRLAEPRLKTGSSLRLVHAHAIPLFEALHSTGMTALFLSKPVYHGPTDDLLGIRFSEADDSFPRSWIAAAVANLDAENEIFKGVKP